MNSELRYSEIRRRIAGLIGDEKPFRWAARMGLKSATFARFWTHEKLLKPSTLRGVAAAAGVSADWLLYGDASPEELGMPAQNAPAQPPVRPLDLETIEAQSPPTSIRPPAANDQMPTAELAPSFDDDFMGLVGEKVDVLYREEGGRPSARVLVQVSMRLYTEACRVGANPAERLGALKLLIEQERQRLRAAAANPTKSKSSA